jgi:hypothetical protein
MIFANETVILRKQQLNADLNKCTKFNCVFSNLTYVHERSRLIATKYVGSGELKRVSRSHSILTVHFAREWRQWFKNNVP